MTVRTNAVQTCDRCEKPFSEKYLKSGDEVPAFKQSGVVVTETTGTSKDEEPKFKVVVSFDDLCPDCRKAVDNLIAKIKLDSKPKVAKKRNRKKKAQTEEAETPNVPEYTESEGPAETPGPDGEPAGASGEAQESQEAAPAEEQAEEQAEEPAEEQAEEPAEEQAEAAPETPEDTPADGPAEDGGNGAEAASSDDNLVTDPETGDVYDKTTGEVVSKGSTNGGESHPF